MSDMPCTVEGCANHSARAGLCWAHLKRRRNDQRLTELGKRIDGKGPKARWARIEKAALDFADDTERPVEPGEDASAAYTSAKHKFREALRRYFADLLPAVYRFEPGRDGRVRFWRRDQPKPK